MSFFVAWRQNKLTKISHPIGDVRGDVVAIPRTLMPRGTPKGPHVQELLTYAMPFPAGIGLRNDPSTYMSGD
jgi:hypothetical protein